MKTVEEIYEEMMAVFRRETGAEGTAASDLSVKLYAVAAQIYGLYAQAEWLARQCFPQTGMLRYGGWNGGERWLPAGSFGFRWRLRRRRT